MDCERLWCVNICSLVVTTAPLWWRMLVIGEVMYESEWAIWEISISSPQFCCEHKDALKKWNPSEKKKEFFFFFISFSSLSLLPSPLFSSSLPFHSLPFPYLLFLTDVPKNQKQNKWKMFHSKMRCHISHLKLASDVVTHWFCNLENTVLKMRRANYQSPEGWEMKY